MTKGAVGAALCLALLPFAVRVCNRSFRNNAWQAYVVATRSEVRRLAEAQQAHYARTGRFAPDVAALGDTTLPSAADVTLAVLEVADSSVRLGGTHRWFRPDAQCTVTVTAQAGRGPMHCVGFTDWFYRPRRM
jgi:hypothetical protein